MENINPSQPQPQPPFHLFVLAEGPWMGEPHRCCRWIASTPKPSWDSAAVEGWPLWGSGQPGQSPGGVKAEGLGMEGLGACAEFNQKMCLGSSLPSGVVEKGSRIISSIAIPGSTTHPRGLWLSLRCRGYTTGRWRNLHNGFLQMCINSTYCI